MNKIEELFEQTEKASVKWTGYFDVYERHLSKFVGKSPKILEIGVLGGGSIELWLKYFGEGTQVIGLDIDSRCLQYKYDGNAQIVLGDQGNPAFWDEFLDKHTDFDIIIDDGSHIMSHQILTLQKTFPHLKLGGVFMCEDTHTSYWPNWNGEYDKPGTFLDYSKYLSDIMNQQHFQNKMDPAVLKTFENLYSMSFYNSMVVLEKEELKLFAIKNSSGMSINNR